MTTLQEKLNALPVSRRKKIEKRAAVLIAEEMVIRKARIASTELR